MGYIYVATNKHNGKQYVGQTIQTVEHRWKAHISEAKKGYRTKLNFAIKKYGSDKFDLSILEETNDCFLDEREQYWIAKLDTFRNGYNCTLGGQGNRRRDDVLRTSIQSLWDSGMPIYNIARELNCGFDSVYRALQFYKPYMQYAERRSYESQVCQYDYDGNLVRQFSSAKEAAEQTGLHISSICNCCYGVSHSAGGYQWRYITDSAPSKMTPPKRKVDQYSLGGEYLGTFSTTGEAAKAVGGCRTAIRRCCVNPSKYMTCKGFQWRYHGDPAPS